MNFLRQRLRLASLFWDRIQFDYLLSVALLIFSILVASYFIPVLPPAWMALVEDYIAEYVLLSVTVVMFASAAIRGRDHAARFFWWLMTAGFGCWLLSQVIGTFMRAAAPWRFEFTKDVLLLAMSCFVVVAADLRPGLIKSTMQSLHAKMAALSSVLLIIGVFGYTALVPAIAGIRGYESPFVVYAFLDTYIALRFIGQGMLSTSRSWCNVMVLIGVGFALITVADLLVVLFDLGWIDYRAGQPLNLVWFLFYIPLFLASRIPAGSAHVVARPRASDESDFVNLAPIMAYGIAIPLIHLAGYGFGVFADDSRAARDLFVLAWLVAAAGVLCWQCYLMRERVAELEKSRLAAQNESEELQAQLRQAQRIEMVGQLSGGIAHEFGNSLFGAETLAQRILSDSKKADARVESAHAQGLIDALAGSRELVRKFNYLGRGEEVESAVINVVDEVRDTIELLKPGISKLIRISFHSDYDDIGAIARKQDIQQITLNLLLNARDSIGERGFVDVHVGQAAAGHDNCTSCGAMIAGDQVWIRVSDSGAGVPESLRRRIFEPLVTSKPAGHGSGLGLSIVHALVHQLRGHIVLGDTRQAHCSFTVLLPAVHLDVSGPLIPGDQGLPHLLIVESDQVIVESIRADKSLHRLHINCVSSADAAEVILRQPDRRPDTVVIGNMHNPIDVVNIIKSAKSAGNTRVLLCSKRQQRAILQTVDGIDSILDQPVDRDIFASALTKR